MKQVKISEEGVGADAVTVIRVKQGSLGGLLFFIPVMIGVFLLFGLVPGLFEGNVTPSLMCGVAFAAFFTLVWGFVAVNEIFRHGELRIGVREIVWFSGVGRVGFTTRLRVEGGMCSRIKLMKAIWTVCVTDRSGKEVGIFDCANAAGCQELCEDVRRRLHDMCGISLNAPPRGAEEAFAAAQFVKSRITVVRDEAGNVQATYRDLHIAKGVAWLVAIAAFFVCMAWLCFVKGNAPYWEILLFVPPVILGSSPFVYCISGRRELSLRNGEGVYFNGVGNIGIKRCFRYDVATEVFKGETDYWMNGRKLPELQIRNLDDTWPQRIFAHPEEKVVEEFALILSESVMAAKNQKI